MWFLDWKSHLEKIIKDLIPEVEKWDLAPKPASLWWTSTFAFENRTDLSIDSKTGRHRIPIKRKFKILGCALESPKKDSGLPRECRVRTNGGEMCAVESEV